jgi:ABC-type arginine transport system ATPase subunit
MITEQIKQIIEVLEQNNITLALLCDDSDCEKELAKTQIEMNNKQIQQLQLLNGIENVNN